MAPQHVKAFMLALQDNISKFEEKHGEIKSPGHESFQEFGVKPPESNLPN
jgi:hypothetical protein